jgi:hypothetical protein
MNESQLTFADTGRLVAGAGRSDSFEHATASVEAALDQLRRAEDTLERQLADLRIYIRSNTSLKTPH